MYTAHSQWENTVLVSFFQLVMSYVGEASTLWASVTSAGGETLDQSASTAPPITSSRVFNGEGEQQQQQPGLL